MGVNRLLEFRPFSKPVPEREIAIAYRNSYPRETLINLLSTVIKDSELAKTA